MWNLTFISEEDFTNHVKATIEKYGEKLESFDLKRFNKNIIDPIKLIFDKTVYQSSWEEIVSNEIFRQRDKSNNNDIGYFHQRIFQYIKNCHVPPNGEEGGWDVIYENPDGIPIPEAGIVHTVYVEMKNKHNTMNSASAGKTFIKMQNQLLNDDDCACFLVEAIAQRSQNIKWETTVDKKKVGHKLIRRVSLDQFYALVTGQEDAFYQKALGSKSKLAKVNFGNYSSHDALNSLIGSPLGYIGSDGGELVKRMNESDVGLILIDEFEKADSSVFNYFLDVLENGKIVNSQAEEYDVNGYIIVFTSNISKEDFKKKISPELRSRFDYKGMFNLLTEEDKLKFVHFRVNQIVDKYKEFVSTDLPERIHGEVVGAIDVTQFKNMRDLNKKIKDAFVERIKVSV